MHESLTPGPETLAPSAARGAGISTSVGPGLPGRGIIVLASLCTLAIGALDVALTGRLSLFFSLSFILVALLAALAVRRDDLFTAGVLPPLLLGSILVVCALAKPESLVSSGATGFGHVWVSGLAHHAGALVSAHAAALLAVGLRLVSDVDDR
jgi:Domain of unknown function (DUF6542)